MFESYIEVRKWLENFIPHTWTRKELGLERISYLLKLLGNPQDKFKSIHIAGTSGKGSTAYYLARLLQSSSQKPIKVGLHISPHLVDIRERMQINGQLIKLTKFTKLIEDIKGPVESMKNSKVGFPSYFEILVAAAFLYFAQEKVDWAVVEVGLGGRLDATNVLNPALTVITNVGLDHTDILGTKVEKIAFEKAGIIKAGVPIITGCPSTHFVRSGSSNLHNSSGSSRKALDVIEKVAKEKNASLIKVNTRTEEKALKFDVIRNINLPIDTFRYNNYNFAFTNKLLALTVVKTLGITLRGEQIDKAFSSTFPGRFEEIEENVILDGAHNVDKVKFLISNLQLMYSQDLKVQISNNKARGASSATARGRSSNVILIVAFKKGKDWKKMVDLLIKNLPVSKVIATKFHAVTDMGKYQAVDPKVIAKYVRSVYRIQTAVYGNSPEAVFETLQARDASSATARGRSSNVILVTGSLYLVGEARTIWHLPEF